jgi:hypothetical protein
VRRGAEGSNFLGYSLGHYYVFGRHRPGRTDLWADYEERRAAAGYDPSAAAAAVANRGRLGATVVEAGTSGLRGALGTPDQVREYFRRYERAGVDMLILSSAAGRNRHEHIMESFELIAREVLPEFVDRDAELDRDKARRLESVVEAVMARKPASDHPPLDPEYVIPAYPRQTADDDQTNKFNRWLDEYRDKVIRGEDVSKRLA